MNSLPTFDELNNIRLELGAAVFEQIRKTGRPDREDCIDIIFELLEMGYVYGVEVAGLDLGEDIPVDRGRMMEVIETPTAGATFRQRIETHISDALQKLETSPETVIETTERLVYELSVLAETETHRVMNEAIQDAAEAYEAGHPGKTVYKQWVTMQDDRVREEHELLDGATIPLDARFYSWTGDSARFPGDFSSPELNVGCRCVLRLVTR